MSIEIKNKRIWIENKSSAIVTFMLRDEGLIHKVQVSEGVNFDCAYLSKSELAQLIAGLQAMYHKMKD